MKKKKPTPVLTITQWGADGEAIKADSIPLALDGATYAITLDNPLAKPASAIHLREKWDPPLLSPLWVRFQSLEMDLLLVDALMAERRTFAELMETAAREALSQK
jgi:hypothetical protein